jgi:hypothetical protein
MPERKLILGPELATAQVQPKLYDMAGDLFGIWDCSPVGLAPNVTVRFDDVVNPPWVFRFRDEWERPFKKFYLTWPAQSGTEIGILVADQCEMRTRSGIIATASELAAAAGSAGPAAGISGVATVTVPAAGAEFSYTVPTGRFRLERVTFLFVTSGVAANRNPYVVVTRGATDITCESRGTITQAASTTRLWQHFGAPSPAFSGNQTAGGAPPAPAEDNVAYIAGGNPVVEGGDIIQSATDSIQAADQFSDIFIHLVAI